MPTTNMTIDARSLGREQVVGPLAAAVVLATAITVGIFVPLVGWENIRFLHVFRWPIVAGIASLVGLALWLAGPVSTLIASGKATPWFAGALLGQGLLLSAATVGSIVGMLLDFPEDMRITWEHNLWAYIGSPVTLFGVLGCIPAMFLGARWGVRVQRSLVNRIA